MSPNPLDPLGVFEEDEFEEDDEELIAKLKSELEKNVIEEIKRASYMARLDHIEEREMEGDIKGIEREMVGPYDFIKVYEELFETIKDKNIRRMAKLLVDYGYWHSGFSQQINSLQGKYGVNINRAERNMDDIIMSHLSYIMDRMEEQFQ